MNEKRLKILLPVVILLVGGIATVTMIKLRKPPATEPPAEYTPLVRAIAVDMQPYQFVVNAQGTVAPRTESALVAEVSGRVLATAAEFASGGYFKAGDVLVTIDPVDYELAVVNARSMVAQARVRAETERAQAEVARTEWKELGDGSNSPLATRQLQLEEAEAALDAAEAALRQAERDLARTKIRAPYTCRIRNKSADVGQFVTRGAPVATIYAVDYVEIGLPVADNELAFLDLPVDYRGGDGPDVKLSAEFGGTQRQWHGRVVRLEGQIDPVSRMVTVVAQVDNPYEREDGQPPLPVGLFVDAQITGRSIDKAVVLPRAALRGDHQVLVIDDENRMRFRDIDVLRATRDEVVVGGGLRDGELVCTSVLEAVTDGMKVRPDTGGSDGDAPPATASESAGGSR